MRTSDDIVERVRDATSIVDVVGAYVRLRKRGRNYLGLCPFHSEKTPSFNVLEDKGIYKCFGCGEGGDVFSFLMKMEGLSFPETLERLAKQAGIEYVRQDQGQSKQKQDLSEALSNACRDYAAYCYRALRAEAGIQALAYLEERRFSEETLKKFGVGYSPEGTHSFLASAAQSPKNLSLYEQAGVLTRGTSGDWYDRFHGRVIFPIYSATGRIIGFGGRILPSTSGTSLAKYVNSPETLLYHKSQVLYGLFQAKDAIRKQEYAILVEGYADVLALSQAGFQNVVAASGTSLTTEQLSLLRRYAKQIVLLFDADLAGRNAALRGIELALAADFDVSVVVLPGKEDPDSYIRENGPEAFAEQLERRASFIETKARLLRDSGAFKTPEGSARAVRSIVESIARIPDAIKREFFIRRIAEKFQLLETTLLTELKRIRTGEERRRAIPVRREAQGPPAQPEAVSLQRTIIKEPTVAERTLVRSFIEDTITAYQAVVEMDFDLGLIEHEMVRSVIMKVIDLLEHIGRPPSVQELLQQFTEDDLAHRFIIEIAAESIHISSEWVDAEPTFEEIKERIRLSVHQSTALVTRQSFEQQLAEVKRELAGDIDEHELNRLLEKSQVLGKKLEEARAIQARFHL